VASARVCAVRAAGRVDTLGDSASLPSRLAVRSSPQRRTWGKIGTLVERRIGRHGKPTNTLQHRSDRHDAVVATGKMRTPGHGQSSGSIHQASAHGESPNNLPSRRLPSCVTW
jgi:hypothetical protein